MKNEHDIIRAFAEAMQANGIRASANESFIADGAIHRFHIEGDHKGDKNGYYVIHADGIAAGHMGSWKTGQSHNWCSRDIEALTEAQREAFRVQMHAAKVQREVVEKARHAKGATRAEKIIAAAVTATDDHPALARKMVPAFGLMRGDYPFISDDGKVYDTLPDVILMPLRDIDGALTSVQAIATDNIRDTGTNKSLLSCGKKSGSFHMLGTPEDNRLIVIAEGYTTSASVHLATGHPVACAVDAGNLMPVAEALRAKYPRADIVFAADDDKFRDGNPGLTKAQKAAEKVRGRVAAPVFESLVGLPTDYNDLHRREGADVVRRQFERALSSLSARKFGFRRVGDHVHDIKPTQWQVNGYIECDSVTVLYGEPAHGKSFLAIDMACSVATGTDWHGRTTKPGAVFYIAGEGHNGIMKRFVAWGIARGVDIENAPLYLSERSIGLIERDSAREVADIVRQLCDETGETPVLIVVDTLARNFGGDENSNTDMGKFIDNLDIELRFPWNATVMIVHHTGKAAPGQPRGASALKAAVDSMYEVTKDTSLTVRFINHKMKDARPPEPLAFTIEDQPLPIDDEYGNPVIAGVLMASDADPSPSAPVDTPSGTNQTAALKSLADLEREHRANLDAANYQDRPARVRAKALYDRMLSAHSIDYKAAWKVVDALTKTGHIAKEGKFVSTNCPF